MCGLGALLAVAAMCLAVLNIILSGNVVAKPPKWTPPRYVVEFGDLVDGLADQYQGVLSREQVRATALGVMSARLSVGPVRVGDAGGLPEALRVLIIQAVDAAAEREAGGNW